jgi:DNA-binding MarR family transcriptional regulator
VPPIRGLVPKKKVVHKPRKATRPWVVPSSIAMLERTSFAWLKVAAGLRKRCVALVAELGVTLHEIAILSCLEENGPMFHNDLALRVGIDKAKLVPLAGGLLGASLVELDYEMPDRRRTQLSLTWSGKALLRNVEARIDRLEVDLFASLSENERQMLSTLTARLLTPHC